MEIDIVRKELTNKTFTDIAKQLSVEVENGEVKALNKYIEAMAIKKILDDYLKIIKDDAQSEVDRTAKDNTYNGAKFSLTNSATTLNYDEDPEYKLLALKLKERQELLKIAYNMSLKGKDLLDNGELIPVVSVKKESEETIKITFPKE